MFGQRNCDRHIERERESEKFLHLCFKNRVSELKKDNLMFKESNVFVGVKQKKRAKNLTIKKEDSERDQQKN